jgi:hypothetical protein
MKVAICGNINSPRAETLAHALLTRGVAVIRVADIPTALEPDMKYIMVEALPNTSDLVLQGYPCLTTETVELRSPDPIQQPQYNDIHKAHRQDSIVRNPFLPQRFKKSSKRF